MKSILENPYRITGLLVGVGAREQERQIRRLKQYIDAEQEPDDGFSFPSLGDLHRTLEKVENAASKLTLDNDKINAALFWFYNGNKITDEPALDALKEKSLYNAYFIWYKKTIKFKSLNSNETPDSLFEKIAKESCNNYSPLFNNNDSSIEIIEHWIKTDIVIKDITKNNSSAFHNLSILKLINAFKNNKIDLKSLEEGIRYKIIFLESEFYNELISITTDETFKITKRELQLVFLNQLHTEIENNGSLNSKEFIEIINKQEFIAKEDFLKGFVQKPIELIENKIDEAKKKRKSSPSTADKTGKTLYDETASELAMLKNILGTNNIKYSSIADKVADEILQCGIDYFKKYKESDTIDPGKPSMNLLLKAKKLSVGNISKQRCQENIDDLQVWIDEKPERDKLKLIENDLKFITSKLERFKNLNDTISNAKDLVETCKPKLFNIRTSLGRTDDFYLKISSAVVNNVQGMLVTVVNDEQELFKFAVNPVSVDMKKIAEISIRRNGANSVNSIDALTNLLTDSYTAKENLKTAIRGAVSVSKILGELDMDNQLKSRYNTNNSTLLSLASQLGISSSSSSSSTSTYSPTTSSSSSSSSNNSSSGCYIATMAYGDYDHPQVMILREFRDSVLNKSQFGKWFIRSYYYYSPKLVELLKNNKTANSFIRKLLNQLIKLIK